MKKISSPFILIWSHPQFLSWANLLVKASSWSALTLELPAVRKMITAVRKMIQNFVIKGNKSWQLFFKNIHTQYVLMFWSLKKTQKYNTCNTVSWGRGSVTQHVIHLQTMLVSYLGYQCINLGWIGVRVSDRGKNYVVQPIFSATKFWDVSDPIKGPESAPSPCCTCPHSNLVSGRAECSGCPHTLIYCLALYVQILSLNMEMFSNFRKFQFQQQHNFWKQHNTRNLRSRRLRNSSTCCSNLSMICWTFCKSMLAIALSKPFTTWPISLVTCG